MRFFVVSFYLFLCIININSGIIVKIVDPPVIPEYNVFKSNSEAIKPLKYKSLTPIEYITDPLIIYASLWGCIGLSIPLWELPSFSVIKNSNEFVERLKIEPFTSGKVESITKPLTNSNGDSLVDDNGNVIQVLKNDFYAKNIVEPSYFTYIAMYMRAKNYHPAIMITELFIFSLIYEFTIRPFFLNSNFEQLIKNPSVGIVFGILLDELSTYLLSTPFIALHVLAYIINPFNALPVARIKPLLFFDPYKGNVSIETIIKL
ncbi:MAG TPA: hypothetical protein PK771_12595 [Spirochaetota bacterium]|nr:hypothetical protein [Spirochaetota bacterium]